MEGAQPAIGELVATARRLTREIADVATALLQAGADIRRVHDRYTDVALKLDTEVEVRALLAATGDDDAVRTLRRLVAELRRIRNEAREELRAS